MRKFLILFTILLLAAGGSSFPPCARADTIVDLTSPVPDPVRGIVARPEADLPPVLSRQDEALYRRIFSLGAAADWSAVDELIGQLDDPLLLGHVLAQRYLSATGYRAQPDELAAWLGRYPDLPEAAQISSLLRAKARKRGPAPPAAIADAPRELPTIGATMPLITVAESRDEQADEGDALRLAGEIRALLDAGALGAAQRLLSSPRAQRLLSPDDTLVLADEVGQAAMDGAWCGGSEDDCAGRRGDTDAAWWAGLAAWREGNYAQATQHFEVVASRSERSPWLASAGAFWAARGHLVGQEPQAVTKWLTAAAAFPRTFYGLLARRIMGLPMAFEWALTSYDRAAVAALAETEAGRRALALVQTGQHERAATTLRALSATTSGELLHGIMVAADRSGAAQLALQLERRLFPRGGYDSAAYPIPHWVPGGDFIADRALIYAVIRQESQFNPRAVSRAGARGVMQLMPGTAQLVARRLGSDDARRWGDPEVNIKLGQYYIAMLLGDPNVGGDLFRLAAAWNGGPGNLDRWQRGVAATDDPLLFIESIPYKETRDFIEKVLANLWIYRDRLGQVDPSLDMLAAGEWPTYVALDRSAVELAHWQQDE